MEKEDFTFKKYLRKNWIIFSILFSLPIIIIGVFLYLYYEQKFDIINLTTIISGSLAYLGTISLGSISVWQVERQRLENQETIANQFFEQNKGVFAIYCEVVRNDVILVVKNIGRSSIEKGEVIFSEDWIEGFNNFEDMSKIKILLKKSLSHDIYLAQSQEIRFYLHTIGNNRSWYEYIRDNECKCKVKFITINRCIEEELSLQFHSVLESCYGENFSEKALNTFEKSLDSISKELENIEKIVEKK